MFRTLKPEYIEIAIPLSVYPSDVIFKCFYWYGDQFSIEIIPEDDSLLKVSLFAKQPLTLAQLNAITERIRNDLIDFKTRDIVSKETRIVRELIIAKAFSHSQEFNEDPPGEISDPVGFNPTD